MDARTEATKRLYRLAMEITANGATPERVRRYEAAMLEHRAKVLGARVFLL